MKLINLFENKSNKAIYDFMDRIGITSNYLILEDGSVDIHDDVSIPDGIKKLPIDINETWDFTCGIDFYTLEGCPHTTRGFYCNSTQITSLEHGPIRVQGNFNASGTGITNLIGAPKFVKNSFRVGKCRLTSLEGAPDMLNDGVFDCSGNVELTSLKGAPSIVKSLMCFDTAITNFDYLPNTDWIDASYCNITNLSNLPKKLRKLDVSHCKITTLEGGPTSVIEMDCSNNYNLTSLKGMPKECEVFKCNHNNIVDPYEYRYALFCKNLNYFSCDEEEIEEIIFKYKFNGTNKLQVLEGQKLLKELSDACK